MPVAVKLTTVNLGSILVSGARNVVEQKKLVAAIARVSLTAGQQQNKIVLGRVPSHTTTVDGRLGASLETVNPINGKVVFEFDIWSASIKEIVETGLNLLQDMSPVVSGRYRTGHTLYVNGAPQESIPSDLSPRDQLLLANPVIYSRRLELGITKDGRSFVVQVKPHIYQRVATILKARFGNQMSFSFQFVTLPDAEPSTGRFAARSPRYLRRGQSIKRRAHAGEAIQAPSILITKLG